MATGLNIYDGACWQIAMAILASSGNSSSLFTHSDTIDLMLKNSYLENDDRQTKVGGWRAATTVEGQFSYNGVAINSMNAQQNQLNASNAFAFRMWPGNGSAAIRSWAPCMSI